MKRVRGFWTRITLASEKIRKRENLMNSLFLLIGSGLSQIIPILLSPILARLYSVQAFGIFGFTQSVIAPLSAIACGRFEMTVVLAKDRRGAISAVLLSYIFSIFLTILLFVFAFIFKTTIYSWFNKELIEPVLFIIPFFLLFQGIHIVNLYWLQRDKLFKKIAINKFIQHSLIGILSLTLAFFFPFTGLVLAMLIGWFVLDLVSYYQIFKAGFNPLEYKKTELIKHFKRYYEYPLFNALTAFLYYFTQSIPTFIISARFFSDEMGYYSLTRQILFIPTSLLAGVISQVFFQRIAENIKDKKFLRPQFFKLLKILLLLGVFMVLILYPYGEWLFKLAFGSKWGISGQYAEVLVFIAFFQFIGTSMLNFLPALKNIKLFSAWQLIYFTSSLSLFMLKYETVIDFFKFYAMIDIFFYSVLVMLVIREVLKFDASLKYKTLNL